MFIPQPELSSDLEWMLKSGQLSQETLAAILVQEYYPVLYRLQAILLGDPLLAHQAVVETFTLALASLHRYREQDPLLWLYGFALQAAPRPGTQPPSPSAESTLRPLLSLDQPPSAAHTSLQRLLSSLDASTRAALYLAFGVDWTAAQIAGLLKLNENQVAHMIASALQTLDPALEELAQRMGQRLDDPGNSLRLGFETGWPTPAFTEQEEQAVIAQVLVGAERRRQHRRLTGAALEITLVSLLVLFVAAGAWGLSSLFSESAPERKVGTVIVTELVYVQQSPVVVEVRVPITPTPPPLPTQVVEQPAVYYLIQDGDSLDEVAAKLGGIEPDALGKVLGLPYGADLNPGSQLKIPGRMLPRARQSSAAQDGSEDAHSPLTAAATSQEISAHLHSPAWRSANLWLEAQFIDRGPLGYIGPPRAETLRAWLSPEQILLFQALPAGAPEDTILFRFRRLPGQTPDPAETYGAEDVFSLPKYRFSLYQLAHPVAVEPLDRGQVTFQVDGVQQLSGRDVLAIDQLDENGDRIARLWLDQVTDLPLRLEKYIPGAAEPYYELQVRRVVYGLDLTDESESKSPRRPSGQPFEALPGQASTQTLAETPQPPHLPPLPSGFDLAQGTLAFRYPDDMHPLAAEAIVRLSVDGYDLGQVAFGNPWSLVCQRSPDGSKLAYISQPGLNPPGDAALRWLDLSAPQEKAHSALDGIFMSELAFAPDSRQLAAFGRYISIDALHVVDTQTGQYRRLIRLARARSMAWSPDMQHLALIGSRMDAPDQERLLVIQLRRGRVVYDEPFDPLLLPAQQYPAVAWGIEFPVQPHTLGDCALPPKP